MWSLELQILQERGSLFFLPRQLPDLWLALAQRRHKLSYLHQERLDSNAEHLTH